MGGRCALLRDASTFTSSPLHPVPHFSAPLFLSQRDIVLTLDQLGLHLDEHVCRTIFVQLLLAVEYLHHNKILHR